MRKFYWYATAYIKKYGLTFFLSVLGAIIVFSFLVPKFAHTLEKSDHKYVGVVGEYTLSSLPSVVTDKLSAGLTKVENNGSVSPLVAERWTVEQDGKTYRFLLKDTVYWQDGKQLTPEDITYNFKDVETIITPNDIVFKLPDAYAPFPVAVAQPLLKSGSISHYFFFDKPTVVGIGEYKIVDYVEKNNFLKQITIDGKNDRYTYRFYLTEEDAVDSFKKGEIDTISDLSRKYDIMDWPTTDTSATISPDRYLALFFNIRSPLFGKNVRQALSYALEKPPAEIRASGPIGPDSWAYLEGSKSYEKDWERGSERMLSEIPPEPLSIELTTTAMFEEQAESIKSQFKAFGDKVYEDCQSNSEVEDKARCENVKINTTIRVTNFPDTSDFQVLLVGQESPPDPDQYHLWHSEQSTNFTGYKNTRIDNLLEKGRQTFDQRERKEIYDEFQQFFLEDAPAIFLNYLETYEVNRK